LWRDWIGAQVSEDGMTEHEQVRDYIWQRLDEPGSEHLRLWPSADGSGDLQVDSQVVTVAEGKVLRVSYRMVIAADWRVRSLRIASEQPDGSAIGLVLQTDGAGNWTDGSGTPLDELQGCLDVDIAVTPFTNTLPIRRLRLVPGHTETIRVVYVPVPSLDVSPWEQRYTALEDGRVRYESVQSGFSRELEVDTSGLVMSYPGLFRRTWPRGT